MTTLVASPSLVSIAYSEPVIKFGEFSLFLESQNLSHQSGQSYHLRPKEFQLLLFLLRNRNKVINKTFLLEVLWNYDIYTPTNTLEVHLSSLRKKLESVSPKRLIQTVHGAGYRLVA